jgi:CrcB protein
MNRFLAVMLGGAFGSVVRYAINIAIAGRYPSRFPIATFLINITGSFLIGLAYTALPDRHSLILRPLIITGVLGGYTTFSAFELETYLSTRSVALIYVAASVGIGFLACLSGVALGKYYTR